MASAITATVTASSITQRTIRVWGTVTVGSGTYTAGGNTINLRSALVNASLAVNPQVPLDVTIKSYSAPNSGYIYAYVPGADESAGKFQVLVQGAAAGDPLADLAAGSTPAGVTGDTIIFIAEFVRG